jgi:hypothetical protein
MKIGYGRGYYGAGQLALVPPRRGSGWFKLALVVGVGAAVWYLWPRKPYPAYDSSGGGGEGPHPPTPTPTPTPPEGQLSQVLTPGEDAQARGYPSQQAYEDAVVASARQLQEAGASVAFAPHFQHLAPRLGP